MTEQPETEGFWIRTEPTIDGATYVVTLSVNEDLSFTLTPTRATAYATKLLTAVAQAEYDAAVLHQMVSLGLEAEVAAQLILDLRGDRVELEAAGLRFDPGVSARAQHPFIHFIWRGEPIAQMDTPSARRHALHVLEAPAAADLDALYLKVLRGQIGLDEGRARNVVAALADHYPTYSVADD